MSLVTITINKMKNHHRHYMIYVQLSLLAGLATLSLSGQGLGHLLVSATPYILTIGLCYLAARMFASVIRMLVPTINSREDHHIVGSTMPMVVISPSQ